MTDKRTDDTDQSSILIVSAAAMGIGGGFVGVVSVLTGQTMFVTFGFLAFCTALILHRKRSLNAGTEQ